MKIYHYLYVFIKKLFYERIKHISLSSFYFMFLNIHLNVKLIYNNYFFINKILYLKF